MATICSIIYTFIWYFDLQCNLLTVYNIFFRVNNNLVLNFYKTHSTYWPLIPIQSHVSMFASWFQTKIANNACKVKSN